MRRSALAGPMIAAVAALALCLAGCGTRSRHATSSASASTTVPAGSGSSSGSASAATTTTSSSSPGGPPLAAGGRLTVAPADGHPGSIIRFTLVAPSASGRHGQTDLSYGLSLAGEQGSACVAEHDASVDAPHAGQPVTVAVGPAELGGRWCAGSYTARVDELARPVCGPAQVCPQFIRVVAVIGPVAFRISR